MKKKELLAQYYPKLLLNFILVGSVILSFTPYWLDPITLYDNKRFFVILYLLMTAIVVIFSHNIRQKIIESLSNLSFVSKTLISFAIVNALLANLHSLYWVKSQAVFTYLLLFILIITIIRPVAIENKVFILRLYIWLTCAMFLSVVLYHWIATSNGAVPNYRDIFSFVNPRFINYIQIWIILPLIYLAWQKKAKTKGWIYAIPVVMHFSLLYALDSRGAFIAAFSGIALWILLSKEKLSRFKFIIYILLFSVLIKWLIFTPFPQYLLHGVWPEGKGVLRLGDSGRLNLWSNAIAMISIWGHGGDTFVCNNDVVSHSPHNSVLLTAVEWGVVTALCYISLVFILLYRTFITASEELRVLGITLLSGFAYSLISGVLNLPLSQGVVAITIASFWAMTNEINQKSIVKAQNYYFLKVAHFLLISTALWGLIFIGYKTYLRIDNQQYRHIRLNVYMPQFWLEQNCMDDKPKLNLPK